VGKTGAGLRFGVSLAELCIDSLENRVDGAIGAGHFKIVNVAGELVVHVRFIRVIHDVEMTVVMGRGFVVVVVVWISHCGAKVQQ
jgi:hypothetical protein